MTLAQYRHNHSGDNHIRANWECRYFTPDPPQFFEGNEMEEVLGKRQGFSVDDDVYFIGDNIAFNIKLRKRINTIKVKTLLEQKTDHFELWRSKIDSALPASEEDWEYVLTLLKSRADALRLSKCLYADQVLDVILEENRNFKWVEIQKHRAFYVMDNTRVEAAKTTVKGKILFSISIESHNLDQARNVRNRLPIDGWGTAKNYVEMLLNLDQANAIFDT